MRRWIAIAAVIALAGCGGGSSDSSSTTTAKESTTTTAAGPKPSPVTDAATLTVADMGGDWAEYKSEAKGKAGGESTCQDTADPTNAFDTVTAISDGKIIQKGKLERWVATSTWAFATPAEAQAFATSRLTDQWIECVRKSTEAGLSKEPVQTVKTYGVTRGKAGDSVGQYSLQYLQEIDGKQQYAGAFAVHTLYLKGAVVIDQFYQAIQRADTDPKGIDDTIGNELNAGIDKVLGRVSA